MKFNVNAPCPCGSGNKYKKCCQIYHKGAIIPSPLALMKARYSAYAAGEVDFIVSTTHPQHEESKKDLTLRKAEIENFSRTTLFKKLEILDTGPSTVTFRVTLEQGGKDISYTEKSLFEKIDGKWLYLSGEVS